MEKALKSVVGTSGHALQASASEATQETSFLSPSSNTGVIIGDPLLRVYEGAREIPWDDFRKLPALKLLNLVQHQTPRSLFCGPCEGNVLQEEVRVLFPEAQREFLVDRRLPQSKDPCLVGGLEGFFPTKTYDLILIASGLPTLKEKRRFFQRIRRGLHVGSSLALCLPAEMEKTLLSPFPELLTNPRWSSLYSHESLKELTRADEIFVLKELEGLKIEHLETFEREWIFSGIGLKRLLYKWQMLAFLEKGISLDHAPLMERFWIQYHRALALKFGTLKPRRGVRMTLKWLLVVAKAI